MTFYISTWMYVESDEDGGIYPQVGGSTSTKEAQAIYWRCVFCFFAFARRFIGDDPSIRLALFTNAATLPTIGTVNLDLALSELGVELYCIPYVWKPDTRRRQWFNQFYLFDILETYEKLLDDGDGCIVIDSDALIVGDPSRMIGALQQAGSLLIDVGVGVDEEVSGLTRRQAATVYRRLTGITLTEPPPYFGGEFYGLDTETLRKALALARVAFPINNSLARGGQPYFSDEAHFFSFLMRQLGYTRSNADQFARRIWTSQKLNNTERYDMDLCLWHVPSEKLYGLEEIFHDLASGEVKLNSLSEAQIKQYAARKLGVGRFYLRKYLGHIFRAARRKIQSVRKAIRVPLAVGLPVAEGLTKLPGHQAR